MWTLLSPSAKAAGYYNTGAHWKGALNPYYLGADGVFQSGFTSGLRAPVANNGDGGSQSTGGVAIDSSGNIYLVDKVDHRINKYDSSGAFLGWIGKIASSPTAGAAGCKGAAVGTFTPGWCKGGTSTYGSGDGMMSSPSYIGLDPSGNLYVTDLNNQRINKYNSSGVFQGWIGKIATSPSGGAAGCNGAAVGTSTPGWCTGGTSASGTGDGMLNAPMGITIDSSGNLYVADRGNHRIDMYSSAGVFQGWIGNIATSPTGGAAGCNGATVGTVTPGWCTGGTSATGTGDGMLAGPSGVALDSSGNLYVTDSFFASSARISKYNSSGVFQGWIGNIATSPTGGAAGCNGAAVGTFTPGWCTGGTSGTGSEDGALSFPTGIAIDSSGNLFVSDGTGARLDKYNSSGAFQGWIGNIGTSPTSGAAGCNGAAVGTFTPGWCKGGFAASGSGDGMMNSPSDVRVDSTGNLYVADSSNFRIIKYSSSGALIGALQSIAVYFSWHRSTAVQAAGVGDGMMHGPYDVKLDSSKNILVLDTLNSRINQYNASGVFQGWIGKIATSPTGGAAGCNGAAVGTFTPGWCTGGTSASGTGDGMMDSPAAFALDSSGNFYVADSNNFRIDKFNSSGVFQGWIGTIGTSPTGGAAGCNGAAVGSFTPGWCKGGTSTGGGTEDGDLSGPNGIALDSSGNIYVSDVNNTRIDKYDSSGAFQGWIGKIATSPTGGAAGCNGAAVGTFTPGWCKGGAATSGTGDGMMSTPNGIALDSAGNLYLADYGNNRINKYNSAGAFQGWIGKIATSPTGGAAGCNGAAVGTLTPGWCTGGTSTFGSGDGMLHFPRAIAFDSAGSFYVSDNLNSRINKYNSAGVFQGWIGAVGTSPTGGATGCNGAAVGTFSSGWCKGGTGFATTVSGDGFQTPMGIAFDSAGYLYVSDAGLNRVGRYSLQGR